MAFAFAVLAVGAVLFIVKFRHTLRAAIAGGIATPSTISLSPLFDVPWAGRSRAGTHAETFAAAGFLRAGTFEVPEIQGLQLVAWAHPGERLYAVTCRHPAAGVWSEVVAPYQDGTERCASGAPGGGQLDRPPWAENVHESGASAARLLALAEAWPKEGRREATPVRFGIDFTGSYNRGMAWRNRHGVTRDEIRRTAAAMKVDVSERDLDRAVAAQRAQLVRRLREECVQTLMATGVTGSGGTRLDACALVVVHAEMTPADALEELGIAIEVPESVSERVEEVGDTETPVRALFTDILRALPEPWRFVHRGSVETPVPADVWERVAGRAGESEEGPEEAQGPPIP